MKWFTRIFSSTRFTLFGMALLAIGAMLVYDNPMAMPVWTLAVPMALLAVNLLTVITTNPRIYRRRGLLVFHLGLLGIVILAAIGRLTLLDGRVEMVEGTAFSPLDITETRKGPLHFGAIDKVSFIQRQYTIDYEPNLIRGPTRSYIQVPDGRGGWEERVIGDDKPLVQEGYRFYTTFNKGFSPVLTWIPDGGQPVTGTVNMPSYPLFDFKQSNSWTPPGAQEIKFWLQLDAGLDMESAWTLDRRNTTGILVVNNGEQRVELKPGEEVALNGGRLRYEQLLQWMGYKIFYDPTLHWLFLCSMIAVLGLASHYWQTFGAVHTAAGKIDALKPARDPAVNRGVM